VLCDYLTEKLYIFIIHSREVVKQAAKAYTTMKDDLAGGKPPSDGVGEKVATIHTITIETKKAIVNKR